MGTSFVKYKEHGFWAHDGWLEMVLFVLVREIDQLDETPKWLEMVRNEWLQSASAGYMGCVPTRLDEFAASDEHRSILSRIAQSALMRVERNLPLPKNDLIVEHWGGYPLTEPNLPLQKEIDDTSRDLEAFELFLRTLKMFVLLFEGQIITTAGDQEALPHLWVIP